MKLLWTIIGVLILAAAGVLVLRPHAGASEPTDSAAAPVHAPGAMTDPPAPPPVPPAPSAPSAPAAVNAGSSVAISMNLDDVLGTGTSSDVPVSGSATGSAHVHPPDAGASVTIAPNARFPGSKLVPASVTRQSDGSLRLDARFTVTGSGTEKDPYVIPWELLVSVRESFDPKKGLRKLPQRVTMFDGQRVRLAGYSAFPITASSPREMLVMFNQWDGCCIGTPPTAYDAAEVKLLSPGTQAQKLAVRGSVQGVLKVDPYEDHGWLLGVYILEGATFTPE